MATILNATLKKDIVFLVLLLIFVVALFCLTKHMKEVKSTKWKLLYLIPLISAFVYLGIYDFEWGLLAGFAACVVVLIGFLREDVKTRRIVCGTAGVLFLLSIVFCLMLPGHRMPSYEKDFRSAMEELKLHYVLTEHKDIDFEALSEKYTPLFRQADANHDEVAATVAWTKFAAEFQDGHVHYIPIDGSVIDKELMEKTAERMYGNDYGFSLMTLENGTTVAVNVEPKSVAENAGIKNGTVITAWNGKSVEEMIGKVKENDIIGGFASAENEAFYETLYAAGMGENEIVVSYLDEAGTVLEVTLPKLGYYNQRLEETMKMIDRDTEVSNLEWVDINEKTSLLRMRSMQYDSQENYGEMAEDLRKQLQILKNKGVTNLVLDLRNNSGGSGEHVKNILQLFAPEGEHVYGYDGVFDKESMQYKKCIPEMVSDLEEQQESVDDVSCNGENTGKTDADQVKYQVGENLTYQGENLWGHGEILILVNSQTVSAGDHFTYLAAGYPNVTVMGFTHTNGSSQGTNAVTFSYGVLTYSAVLLLNEDGTVFIDSDETRQTTTPLDVKIPFDEKAVESIFEKKEDYVLDYAMEYMGW